MTSAAPEMQAVLERLEKLERQNRRLKRSALAALVLATGLATIYATQPVPQRITAHEFDVVDNSGRVRVAMGMVSRRKDVPAVNSGIYLYDTQGKERAEWVLDVGGAGFVLCDAEGNPHTALNVTPEAVSSIWLSDAEGFALHMGSTQTETPRTGALHQTSAASIVMFDKEKKVIWRAP